MPIERKLAAIMFTAIPDYSSISARDEEEALTLLENQTQALTPIIEEYGGTLHKKLGDGLLISFSTITNAVICASKFQKKAQSIENLNLQISIHEGEISFKDDDILGKHVNLSALILRYSTVGGVVISDKVYQNISNVPEFETKYICEENFQGFSEKTKMYAITSHGFKFNPIDSNDKPKKEKSLIKTLLERRIPQILGSYLVAGTSLILFIEYLIDKYQFPSHYPTLALFALIGILPSVLIIAYFHGAPGKDEWTKVEKIGIPVNVLFIAGILFFGDSVNLWIIDVESEGIIITENVYISQVRSSIEDLRAFEDTMQINGINHTLSPISIDKIKKLNESILSNTIPALSREFNYISHLDLIDEMAKDGNLPVDFDYRYNIKRKETEEVADSNIFEETYEGSTNQFQIESDIHIAIYLNVYELSPLVDNVEKYVALFGCKILYADILGSDNNSLKKYYNKEYLSFKKMDLYDIGILRSAHSGSHELLSSSLDEIPVQLSHKINNLLLSVINAGYIYYYKPFKAEITAIKNESIIIKHNDINSRLKRNMNLSVTRNYHSDLDGNKKFKTDLINYKYAIENNDSLMTIFIENNSSREFTQTALDLIIGGNHFLSSPHRSFNKNFGAEIKIIEIFDTTAKGITIKKNDNPYIKIQVGDNLEFN